MKKLLLLFALLLVAAPLHAQTVITEAADFTTLTPFQTSCDCQDMQQWHLDWTHAREAWLTHTGTRSIKVGIVSSGIDTLSYELGGYGDSAISFARPNVYGPNMWINPGEVYDRIDNDGNGYIDDVRGWNFATGSSSLPLGGGDNNVFDTYVMGTLFATTMGAAGPAMAYRGVGIAPLVTIVPVKWYEGGAVGDGYQLAAGIRYARTVGCKIIVCHGATNAEFEPFNTEIAANTAAGILTIWSGGQGVSADGNIDACPSPCTSGPAFPMKNADPNLLVVCGGSLVDGSGFQNMIIPGGMNWGPVSVDMSASTYNANTIHNPIFPIIQRSIQTTGPGEQWGTWNGTSNAATTMVAGAAALVWGSHPTWTAAQVKAVLMATAGANQYPGLAGKTVTGGTLNVNYAVDYADSLAGITEIESTVGVPVVQKAPEIRPGTYDVTGRRVDSATKRSGVTFTAGKKKVGIK